MGGGGIHKNCIEQYGNFFGRGGEGEILEEIIIGSEG